MSSLAVMLVSMIGCAVCFALFVLFGRMDLKRRGRKYDYLSGFIFEHGEVSDKLGIASRTMLSLFFAFGILGCFVLSFSEETSGLLGLLVLLGVLALLEGISGEAISIVPAYSFGPHLSSTVAFFFSSIMVDVVSGICLLNYRGGPSSRATWIRMGWSPPSARARSCSPAANGPACCWTWRASCSSPSAAT